MGMRKTRVFPDVTRQALLKSSMARKSAARDRFGLWVEAHKEIVAVDLSSYVDVHTPVKATYVVCGHTGTPRPNNLVRKPECRVCADIRQGRGSRLSYGVVLSRFCDVHAGVYDYSHVKFVHTKNPVEIVCARHGSFFQSPEKHISGQGCPTCGARASKAEGEVATYLEGIGCVVERRNRQVLAPKEVDMWLPEYRVAVEYHGLYWHTDERVANIHREKWEAAQRQGIRLIQVFEDEWLSKQEIVKQRLAAILGKSVKLMARKCRVVELDTSQSRKLLDAWHSQGSSRSTDERFGLTYDGNVVAVATFGHRKAGRMVGGGGWEVLRYASQGQVLGGFGRLLAAFRKKWPASPLVSYCDLRYGDGKMYAASGFTLEGVTEPDYWWVPRGEVRRVPRYQTQKHKLEKHPQLGKYFSPDKTEAQICAAAGWLRIAGVGHQKWVLTV